ncbi:MAG: DUF932 domain-containing protein [Pirellulaceae bacterium]|nr:DUF932 domain-containing protein [Pirellulaceae bacterium]
MKTGREMENILGELLRQSEAKRDFLTPANQLRFSAQGDAPTLTLELGSDSEEFTLLPSGHQQLAERLEIPKPYYDRMRQEAPNLLEENIATWLIRSEKQFLVRTLDNRARAILSDRYRVLDNDELANVALPILMDHGFQVISAEITPRKFYLKAVTPKIQAEVTPGDVVQAGIVLSNSEIGLGTLKIEPLLYFLVCSNGTIVPDASLRRQHVGRHIGELENAQAYYSEDTQRADDHAFWLKVRDMLRATLKQPRFDAYLNRLQDAAAEPIKADPFKVVEVTTKRFRLNELESNTVLKNLLAGHNGKAELSRYGLMQAITRSSQEHEDYDRATELEQLGGQILTLSNANWKQISEGIHA